jgi:heme oxygenase
MIDKEQEETWMQELRDREDGYIHARLDQLERGLMSVNEFRKKFFDDRRPVYLKEEAIEYIYRDATVNAARLRVSRKYENVRQEDAEEIDKWIKYWDDVSASCASALSIGENDNG